MLVTFKNKLKYVILSGRILSSILWMIIIHAWRLLRFLGGKFWSMILYTYYIIDETLSSQPKDPVQLLYKDKKGQLQLQDRQLRLILKNVKDRQLVVVSVVGAFRRGKSFLLNFMLRYLRAQGTKGWMEGKEDKALDGFSWRGGKNRDTTGILVWPEIFPVSKTKAILLVDTQGTFDERTSLQDNTFIFALSTLLSSVQIFNLSERIQMDDLDNLQYFTAFGRMLKEDLQSTAFQKLILLIRDWKFPAEKEFGAIGGKNYLNEWLYSDCPNQQLIETFATCFSDVSCFLLPHPGEKVSTDKEFQGEISDIEKLFLDYLDDFINFVLSPEKLESKQISGRKMKARELPGYLRACVKALQQQQPSMLVQSLVSQKAKKEIDTAVLLYKRAMDERCGGIGSVTDLELVDKGAQEQAREHLRSTMKDLITEDHDKQLKEKLDAQLKIYSQENAVKARRELEEQIRQELVPAQTRSLKQYEENLRESVGGTLTLQSNLKTRYNLEWKKALNMFDLSAKRFKKEDIQQYKNELTKGMNAIYAAVKSSNDARLRDRASLVSQATMVHYEQLMAQSSSSEASTVNGLKARHLASCKIAFRDFQKLEDNIGKSFCQPYRKNIEQAMTTFHHNLETEVNKKVRKFEAQEGLDAAKTRALDQYRACMDITMNSNKLVVRFVEEEKTARDEALNTFDRAANEYFLNDYDGFILVRKLLQEEISNYHQLLNQEAVKRIQKIRTDHAYLVASKSEALDQYKAAMQVTRRVLYNDVVDESAALDCLTKFDNAAFAYLDEYDEEISSLRNVLKQDIKQFEETKMTS